MSVAFSWWLVIELVGLASAPLAAAIFRNLPDAGWSLTKPLGLLVLGWLIWLPLSLIHTLPFNVAWIVGTFLVFVLANAALLRLSAVRRALVHLFSASWAYALLTEALFTAAFAVMLWERSFTPAVVDTEKFMDEAFLAAIWRAPHLPPPDPWLSGYSLNYYYFGHYLMALPAKLLGTVPAVAFNLAVGLTFALAFIAIFGVAANIAASVRRASRTSSPSSLLASAPAGVVAALLTLVVGNLAGALVWLKQAQRVAKTDPALGGNLWAWWTHRDLWMSYDWWSPSRVLPNTINEFPAFSFILADLHAHVLALPFAALAVGLAFNLLRAHGRGVLAFGGRLWPLGLLAAAVALGGLYVTNGWDLPTYLGLALLALLLQQWLAHGRALTRDLLLDAGVAVAMLVSLAFLLYFPFYLGFSSPAQGVGLVPPSQRSLPGDVMSIFALPALLALTYLATRLGPLLQRDALPALAEAWSPSSRERVAKRLSAVPTTLLGALPLALLVALTMLTSGSTGWTVFWSGLIVIICAALLLTDSARTGEPAQRGGMMTTLLIGCAAGLLMICEVIYLRDVFGGQLFRMNSVFKFYYQVWLLLGIASGPLLVWLGARAIDAIRGALARAIPTQSPTQPAPPAPALVMAGAGGAASALPVESAGNPEPSRAVSSMWTSMVAGVSATAWSVALAALLVASAIYPTLAVAARTTNLTLSHSLDGAAYMAQDATDTGDGPAIAWLNAHVSGDAVIVEAAKYDEYTHLGRVSAFTGLPTLIGWGGHELQWRYNWLQRPANADTLSQRINAVTQIYTNPDSGAVLEVLRQYHVSYVYVGNAERHEYPAANLNRLGGFLRVVYHDANVTIYAVPPVNR
jgi:YYY domain-containing protein